MIPVIYWSGTGNTKLMAEKVCEAIKESGKEVALFEVGQANISVIEQCNAVALGCPAMGAEVLEEYEFEPFFQEAEAILKGKKVALFGSYGWGGSYMQDWQQRVLNAGGELVADGVLAMNEPDMVALEECELLGKKLAAAE